MIMSKLQFAAYPAVAALALLAAVSAHAQSTEGADYDAVSSGQALAAPSLPTTRLPAVVVRGERMAPVDVYGYDYNPLAQAKSLKSRAEVTAAIPQALRAVQHLAFVNGENIGPFFQAGYAPQAALQAAPLRLAVARSSR
jgi:hypothetical protein